MLTIRVTDDEHARLLERCEGKQLAVWMRRDQRKITQGQCQRFVNTDVGVPQGSQQHPAMQIRTYDSYDHDYAKLGSDTIEWCKTFRGMA
ncbi:hypothetical protein [Escherichia coli]|uniref:hypothetical protein n=1 Tax=Escherichia coli TaxID=562 RepID=UPI0032E861DD